jgi:hypothetical protein
MSVGYNKKKVMIFFTAILIVFILTPNFQYVAENVPAQGHYFGYYVNDNRTILVNNEIKGMPKQMSSFSVTITPSSATIDVGQSVTFTATVSPPSSSYTYQWYLNNNKVGSNLTSYYFAPSQSGSYSIRVNVTNGTESSNNSVTVTVYPAPAVTISPSSARIHVGQTIEISSTVTGGTGKFTYAWYLNGSLTTVISQDYSFTPAGNATYYLYVIVNDTGTVSGTPSTLSVKSNVAQITAYFVTYPVVFQESGLPLGTKWYVNLTNGQSHPYIGSLNLFYEPNGTYTFTIASANKIYAPSPSSGTFVVNGQEVSLVIYFSPVLYHVFFNQSAGSQLPNGTVWYVNITSGPSLHSTSTSIEGLLPNGTYDFTVSTSNKEYYPTPYSGSFRVNGHALVVSVAFSLFTYPVQITETGLPPDAQWQVEVREYPPLNISNITTSTVQTITLELPNGSYFYSIHSGTQTYGPFPSNGSFSVIGAPVSITAKFLRLYKVIFFESGLPIIPQKVVWYVNVSGSLSVSSTNNTISFWEPNGTWHYSVSTNDQWYIILKQQRSGNFTINGESISPFPSNSPLIFYELFNVTIIEEKLPLGTPWYVNISNGSSFSSISSSIKFTGINGTYNYSMSSGNKLYRPLNYTGSFTINGSSVSIKALFYLVTYTVTFSEAGLVNNTIWSVTINNNTMISVNSTVTFRLSNGTFQYSIQPLPGFSTKYYQGNITVNGTSNLLNVLWTLVTYYFNVTQSGLSSKMHWSVVIDGKTFYGAVVKKSSNATGALISFLLPNGSYNYTVNPPLGYSGSSLSGRVVIKGNSTAVAVKIVPPNYFLIGLGSGITVVAVAISIGLMMRREHRSLFVKRDPFSGKKREFRFRK